MNRERKELAPFDPAADWTNVQDIETSHRYPDVYQELSPSNLIASKSESSNIFDFVGENNLKLRIQIFRADIWRVRYTSRGFARDFSYALDPQFDAQATSVALEETATTYTLKGEAVTCIISKASGQLIFQTMEDEQEILRDAAPYMERSTILEGTNHLRASFAAPAEEVYYGLGDKSWDLNLRGRHFNNWNSDSFGYDKERDPLYRTIPFYYGVVGAQAYGVFLHNTWRTHFDFDSQSDGITRIWSEGGELDYFLCYGPQLDQVAMAYHDLTGKPELPPLWALGFHQCRWSYYPEARVRELADNFREMNIPCDAIYLDIDYMDNYRCFTWDKEHFPKLGKMIGDLREQGFQTVVMIDPGIKKDDQYHVYQEGAANDYFCRRTSGEVMEGPVWPPVCVWPEFTRQEVREWWGGLYKELYNEEGVSGFWNDMNEPAVFGVNNLTFPTTVLHNYDGAPCDHRQAHNIYGQQMARATYEGLKNLQEKKRPFVLTRATFSGGQRHAAVWTGDNVASWDHLRLANRQCQRLSISGFSLVGTDIGGFVDQPSPELLIRWLQLGIFHPVFRVHSMGNNIDGAAEADAEEVKKSEHLNRLDQEPWVFGEPYTSQARQAIEFRYKLLPYLYTATYQHVQTGRPILRSLSFVDQIDAVAQRRENEFLLGDHLLVSPVTREGAKRQRTYLPKGNWCDFYTGKALIGQRFVQQAVDENSIPLYVKAGAVVAQYPVQQYTNEIPISEVSLRTYFGTTSTKSEYYTDAGEGYGDHCLHTFETKGESDYFTLQQTVTGAYDEPLEVFIVQLYSLPFRPERVLIDGVEVQQLDEIDGGFEVVVPGDFKTLEVRQ